MKRICKACGQEYESAPSRNLKYCSNVCNGIGRRENLVEKTFGRLSVLRLNHIGKWGEGFWVCLCKCGNTVVVKGPSLKSGNTRSCGCLISDTMKSKTGEKSSTYKHGMRRSRIYRIWCGMLARCENKNATHFRYYGGRGIKVCKTWHCSTTFIKWAMANGYRDDLTIDRINNDGDYGPGNCRWITLKENVSRSNSEHPRIKKGEGNGGK